jgi:hypothetical protein
MLEVPIQLLETFMNMGTEESLHALLFSGLHFIDVLELESRGTLLVALQS